jgi:peptidoglycan/xylan/chitin deacetylase (PgdA/CDA1 family)
MRSPIPRWIRERRRPSGIILAYHNIVPDGEPVAGELSLHTAQSDFADQLDLILESYDVVPLERLSSDLDPASGRSRVAITFDDAYVGAVTAGLDEVHSRGLAATVFVAPGILGNGGSWWDRLATGLDGTLPASVRPQALTTLKGRQHDILSWAERVGVSTELGLPDHAIPATEDLLLRRATVPGVTLGAHSWSHPNLASLPSAQCLEELERGHAWIQAKAPRPLDWLAYPYGMRNQAVVEGAHRLYEGALLVNGGPAIARARPTFESALETPRVNVPRGVSLEGLALRLSGVVSA